MPDKRNDVITWDEFFMRVAVAAQLRSKDPNTQVGACIADTNHRILSVGYNGTPSALNDDDFPWGVSDDPLLDKHSYVVHAEANAVLNYRGSLKDLNHATIYVTLFPCHEVREDPRAGGHRRGRVPKRQIRRHRKQPDFQADLRFLRHLVSRDELGRVARRDVPFGCAVSRMLAPVCRPACQFVLRFQNIFSRAVCSAVRTSGKNRRIR